MTLEISHTLKDGSIAITKTLDNGGKVTVAHVFNDNKIANLICNAPDMLAMLKFFAYDAALTISDVREASKELINQIEGN